MELKEENNKGAKPHVIEEIPMHTESPRNSIKGGWQMGWVFKAPIRNDAITEAKGEWLLKQRMSSQEVQ